MSIDIEERDGGVRLRVRVQPRASRTEIAGEHGGALKVRLTAPPVEGAANEQLVKLVAKAVGVPPSAVRVARGATGRDKTLEIDGVDAGRVRRALGP